MEQLRQQVLKAALPHVPFDGWSQTTLNMATSDAGVDETLAKAAFPGGAVDLALAYHQAGDALMMEQLAAADLSEMRFRDRIAFAIRTRLELVEDKELVRRGTTLFSLPQNAGKGAGAIWGTCDKIWTTLGDTSDDANWYSKRATLSAVYSAVVLYWLGDDSEDDAASWEFLDRRIDNVMQFEKLKASTAFKPIKAVTSRLFAGVKAPGQCRRTDLPGQITTE